MTDFPYEFDETLRYEGYKCDGSCASRLVKHEGPIWMEICLDPKCAKIHAKCEHRILDPVRQKETPLSPMRSINTWNEGGTVLTCQYCGADVT